MFVLVRFAGIASTWPIVAIASGALDSLPHNGYVVTTIRSICRESYSAAYPGVAAMTVIVPALGAALAVVLFGFRAKPARFRWVRANRRNSSPVERVGSST